MTFIKKIKNGLARKRNRNTNKNNATQQEARDITVWKNKTTELKEYSFTRYVNR